LLFFINIIITEWKYWSLFSEHVGILSKYEMLILDKE